MRFCMFVVLFTFHQFIVVQILLNMYSHLNAVFSQRQTIYETTIDNQSIIQQFWSLVIIIKNWIKIVEIFIRAIKKKWVLDMSQLRRMKWISSKYTSFKTTFKCYMFLWTSFEIIDCQSATCRIHRIRYSESWSIRN